jgi:hypothetical protein
MQTNPELILIESKLRLGATNKDIREEFKIGQEKVENFRAMFKIPRSKIVNILNKNSNFENWIKSVTITPLYDKDLAILINNYKLFKTIKVDARRASEIRRFYNIPSLMPENNYKNNYDREKGYIIRNCKFMSSRRNIYFSLNYWDFEIPEYCPILNIKLTYRHESDGNDFSHASLDRIDNSKGYIKGNVIVISRLANSMKNSANFEQLLTFCENMKILINHYKNQGALGNITDVFSNYKIKKFSLDS